MATLLHISASPRGERSYSLRTAKAFIESYMAAHPGDTLRSLDLAAGTVPAFDTVAVSAKYRILHGESHTEEEGRAWQAVKSAVADFKAADKLVISSPMWNFGVPYRLKQYLDVIVQPGSTFSYSAEEGYKGLVTGRPAMLILARGGEYESGAETASYDFQKPYLELILGFMGFTEVRSIVVQPTLQGGREVAKQKLDEAIAAAREKANLF